MKNVMTVAWEIAREGVKKFGGSVKEYFAEALRMAWIIVKSGMEKAKFAMLETLTGSRKHKTWVAEITGTHETYKFNRQFIEEWDNDGANKFWRLYNGKVYEVCDGGHRYFAKVEKGEIEEITAGQVTVLFA